MEHYIEIAIYQKSEDGIEPDLFIKSLRINTCDWNNSKNEFDGIQDYLVSQGF